MVLLNSAPNKQFLAKSSGFSGLSIFPGGGFPWLGPRKVIDFQFVQLFLIVKTGKIIPSSLHSMCVCFMAQACPTLATP